MKNQVYINRKTQKNNLVVVIFMFFFLLTISASAQKTASVSGNWNSQATWGYSGIPTATDAVTIASGVTVTVNVSNATCASMVVGNSPGMATLNFNNGSQLTSSGTVTFGTASGGNNRLGTISMANGGTLICTGFAVANTGTNVWTPGIGTVQLTATNNLPGEIITNFNNLTISSGTTKLGVSTTIGGTLSLTTGSLDVNAFTGSAGEIVGSGSLTNSGNTNTFTIGSLNTSTTYSGVISAATAANLAITKTGTGSLTLSSSNTYGGSTLISAGTLKLANTTALGTSSATTVSSGSVLDLNGTTLSTARPLTLNGTGLTATPAGALTNTGIAASYSGNITLGSASTITATSSGTLTCSGAIAGAFALTLDGAAGTGTMSGVISSPTSLTKNGAGTWVLSGTNTYTGTTTLNAGITSIAAANNLGTRGDCF